MHGKVVRLPKNLHPFHATLNRSRAPLNRYKCVGRTSPSARALSAGRRVLRLPALR